VNRTVICRFQLGASEMIHIFVRNGKKKNCGNYILIYNSNWMHKSQSLFNPLNGELNHICYLLALLAHHFLHVSRI